MRVHDLEIRPPGGVWLIVTTGQCEKHKVRQSRRLS